MTRIVSNTTKEYPCTMCGSPGNIVREDATNPRLKCNSDQCGFMYDGQDSLEMKKAGKIPDGPPVIPQDDPVETGPPEPEYTESQPQERLPLLVKLPRTPSFVLISKDRREFEFVTKVTLKREVLKWTAASKKFDLFELTSKKVDARIDIN